MENIHASCVSIDGKGVLLTGKSGSGKSDLALRLIDSGASLVSDDRTDIWAKDGVLFASAPPQLEGVIEVRGIGLLKMPFLPSVPVVLFADLSGTKERMPENEEAVMLGCRLKLIRIAAFEASAAAKIRACLVCPLVDKVTS